GVSTFTGGTTVSGGSLRLSDNNHQILNSPPEGSTGIVPMDISGDFNLTGITNDHDLFTGGFDGNGLALSAAQIEPTVSWTPQIFQPTVLFSLGPSEDSDVVQALGQDLNLTSGQYYSLNILAAAVGGNQPSKTFTVNYT